MKAWLLSTFAIGALSAQTMTVQLPDTTLVGTAREINSAIVQRLTAFGQSGALGTTYQSVSKFEFGYDRFNVDVPPADTIIVVGATGLAMGYLAERLLSGRHHRGDHLNFGGGLRWRVSGHDYFRRDSSYGVLFRVQDASRQTVQAMVAWDEKNGAGNLVGLLRLKLPNVFGAMRQFNLDFTRLNQETQDFSIEVGEPKLLNLPFGLEVAFGQSLRDSLYLSREWSLRLTSLPTANWRGSIGVGGKSVHVTDHGLSSGLIASDIRTVEATLENETLNDPINPTEGYLIDILASGGTITGARLASNSGLASFTVVAEWVTDWRALVFAQSLLGSATIGFGYTPQLSDFSNYGGGLSVRGYREDHFIAPKGLVARNEVRMAIGRRSRVHIFADVGLIENSGGSSQSLGSVGLGWVIPAGNNLIQADFALNREQKFKSAKLHLRLVNILGGN